MLQSAMPSMRCLTPPSRPVWSVSGDDPSPARLRRDLAGPRLDACRHRPPTGRWGYLLRSPGTASLLTSDVSLVPWSWLLAATTLLVGLAAVGWGSLLRRLLRLPDAGILGLLAGLPAGIAALATALTLLTAAGLAPTGAAAGTVLLGLVWLGRCTRRPDPGACTVVAGLLLVALVWGFQAGRVHVAGDAAELWGPLAAAIARGDVPRFGMWADEGFAVGAATLLAGAPDAWGQAVWGLAAGARAALAATV
jgi:hypothetical protein